jgi:alginate O-acetyltransferase complex protein AlgI
MAVGLGRMFGFEFIKNFNDPYHADSITDFWRRWHISLSTFLRDYLYIPLGGNRLGLRRTYINLALVMLLGGLWHGAHWQFIVWGAFHGLFLASERLLGKTSFYEVMPRPLRVGLTFILILISWVPFRADNLVVAVNNLGAMFGLVTPSAAAPLLGGEVLSINSLVMVAICGLIVGLRTQAWDFVQNLTWGKVALSLGLFVVAVAAMFAQAFNPFLYFQF